MSGFSPTHGWQYTSPAEQNTADEVHRESVASYGLKAVNPRGERERILIGVPGWNGLVPEAQEPFMRMLLRTQRELPDLEISVLIVSKSEQFRARNKIVNAALGNDCTWLLMLDDDMIPPANLVVELIRNNKDVCGGLYYQRGGAFHPVIMRTTELPTGEWKNSFYPLTDPIITQPGLYPVDVIGGGCMLFKTELFHKLQEPYFWWEQNVGTDIAICHRLKEETGAEIWCDTRLELGHVSGERPIITSSSVPLVNRKLAVINEQLWNDLKAYTHMGDEELQGKLDACSDNEFRVKQWHAHERDTWADIRAFYAEDWHLYNLAYWNLTERSIMKEWVLFQSEGLLPRDQRRLVIDYGAGLGHVAIPLAEQGIEVLAMDLDGVATMPFLKWRVVQRKASVQCISLPNEVPTSKLALADGVVMISVMDHLTDPYGVCEWANQVVKPGGFFVCDYVRQSDESNPQHLDNYDVAGFDRWMAERGWTSSPEYPWLFLKER